MQELQQKLQGVFANIYEQRMRDVPVCNPALQVEAVGFREWDGYYLGVMLTPWFMNLMLLPRESQVLAQASIGSKQMLAFPSGRYEFVHGVEDELGPYLMCSLFSPMFDFQDQTTAVEVANISLQEIMQEANQDTVSRRDNEIIRIWNGEQEADATEPEGEQVASVAPAAAMSRRDFLRGSRRRSEDGDVGN